jgi:hypothetical protein
MKSVYLFSFLLVCILLQSCMADYGPIKEGDAKVVIQVATRGSYQFLILYEKELYYPENLPEEYKVVSQDTIPVFIRFKLTDEGADIFTPAPNDVPVFMKSIPVIRLAEIRRR